MQLRAWFVALLTLKEWAMILLPILLIEQAKFIEGYSVAEIEEFLFVESERQFIGDVIGRRGIYHSLSLGAEC
ncbi:MAG TPA: hypothetical protein VGC66_25335 [Pyrinomonadaceae bacterium]|jgi:hypothetical protein